MNTRSSLSNASRTEVVTKTSDQQDPQKSKLILKLKDNMKPSIQWSSDTIDNEKLGRKSSKRCCIFHKNKAFGESDSDESDSDTEVAKVQTLNNNKHPNYQRHHA